MNSRSLLLSRVDYSIAQHSSIEYIVVELLIISISWFFCDNLSWVLILESPSMSSHHVHVWVFDKLLLIG